MRRVFVPLLLLCFSPATPHVAAAPATRPLRIGVAVRGGPHSLLTPLVYWGGFQTKTACYEGLVRYGVDGKLEPCLAQRWQMSPDGRTIDLELRDGVVFHDGSILDAETVRDHLVRWRGNPSNRWFGSTARFERFEVLGPRRLRVVLTEPWPFLEECAAVINPAFVVGKGAYTHEGAFVRTVGTGPYRLVDHRDSEWFAFEANPSWWRGTPHLARVELLAMPSGHAESKETVRFLTSGAVDLVIDGSGPLIPREAAREMQHDADYRVWTGPGTETTMLVLNVARAPFADVANRRRLAAAIDREELVAKGELGFGDPATTLFAPGWAGWPREGAAVAAPAGGGAFAATMLVPDSVAARVHRHTALLAGQLARAGVTLRIDVVDRDAYARRSREGDYDLVFRSTYGVPYDPYVTAQTLFFDRPAGETAASSPPAWRDETVRAALLEGFASPEPARRAAAFSRVQARLDDQVPIVPLFRSQRVAIGRRGIEGLELGVDGYDLGLGGLSAPGLRDLPVRADGTASATPEGADPRRAEVPLPAAGGWEAFLVLDNGGTGVWTVGSFQVFDGLGCPEVVGLDDDGQCHVLVSYSGKWTPTHAIHDRAWLGGLAYGDVDPRVEGAELYTGGQRGNLYQVVAHRQGVLDSRLVATFPGRELHTLVALPDRRLLVFTNPGGLFLVTPTGADGRFEAALVEELRGRVRDAVLLPGAEGAAPAVATVSRAGRLRILRLVRGAPAWEKVYAGGMGLGRIAVRPPRAGAPLVLYSTHDDGRILRHEQTGGGWRTEIVYRGRQGPRGLAAGRFAEDPAAETVAIFGYSRDVELLTRGADGWSAETIFTDVEKGHWLAVAEVEGRNGTQELLASGYGGRIVLLARPPGYATAR